MTSYCFALLGQRIITFIGENNFKSEAYIDAFLRGKDIMYNAYVKSTGGYISGELKLDITLHLLAGGDFYNLAVAFDVYPDHYKIKLYEVLKNWVINPNLGNLHILKYLGDKTAMATVSKEFSVRSNGVLIGAIGATDG